MVMLNYDLSEETGDMGFDALPAGVYEAHIIKSEGAFSKNNSDEYLTFTWQILSGDFKGRLLFDRAMLEGKGKKYGFNKLKAIALAVGHRNPNNIGDSSTLHGISCNIKVVQRTWQDELQNEIKNYTKQPLFDSGNPGQDQQAVESQQKKRTPPPPPPRNQLPPDEMPDQEDCPF